MFIVCVFADKIDAPVTVYGRRETIAALRQHVFNWVIWPDFGALPTPENPVLRFIECNPGDTVRLGNRHFHAVDVRHSVPAMGYTVQNSAGAFAVSGDTSTNETLWPVLNACEDLRALVIEVSFPDEQCDLAATSGHYCPRTLTDDLAKLRHAPDIWLTGMKPGAEQQILDQVMCALPERNVKMLEKGTTIFV
jgi:cAMP phosphodiesterase